MEVRIELASHEGNVSVRKGGRVLGSRAFAVDGNLSQNILLEIDALLRETHIAVETLERVECIAHDAGLTTTRIGNVVANTMNFVLQSNKK